MVTTSLDEINKDPTGKYIFIIGGGIVGASLAFYLSESQTKCRVIVLDRSQDTLLGSTGRAPGLVGQFNENPALTKLAMDSVKEYSSIPGGFDKIGGLEIASTAAGAELILKRQRLAQAAGLPAELLSSEAAAGLAPDFIKDGTVRLGLHFPADGTADAKAITAYYRKMAEEKGAVFLEVSVTRLEAVEGSIDTISTSEGCLKARSNPVVLATGIWTRPFAKNILSETPIPIIPVAHPYAFTSTRPRRQGKPYPFVRWPEKHVYARDHGDCDGLGTYHHIPLEVDKLSDSATGVWPESFESTLTRSAKECMKNANEFIISKNTDDSNAFSGLQPFNGNARQRPSCWETTRVNEPLAMCCNMGDSRGRHYKAACSTDRAGARMRQWARTESRR